MNNEEKRHEAAALKYDAKTDRAPQLIAAGKGYAAESIIKTAYESGIQVVRDDKLSSVLQKMKVGDEIPEQLYKAVAEILFFICNVDSELKAKFGMTK
jgi:flagellar biosynthesis protein